MKAVVTGGAGFIGSNLAAALVGKGHTAVIVDNFSTGRRQNLAGIVREAQVIEGDIRDEALLARAFAGAEVIFHEAALPSVARSVDSPAESHEVNATGTLKVLMAARRAGARRVVYASSSSAYGDTPTLPKVETMAPSPLSPYAVSKLAGEYYCRIFPALYGLETVSLRYFNVFGPHQDPKSQYAAVVPLFITEALAGGTVHIDGDGEQSRDFTFIENVVEANILAANAKGAAGEVFNIGVGRASTINELFRTVCAITGKSASVEHGAARSGDVKHSVADISKARKLLGYEAKFDFEAGLVKTVEYFAKHPAG